MRLSCKVALKKAEYMRLQQEIAPSQAGFRNLCPTHWTVRASSLKSILDNYDVLEQSLKKFTEMSARDPEMLACCTGLGAQFSSFLFLFGVFLGHHPLPLAENLSVSLQSKRMSAAVAQELTSLTLKVLGELSLNDD